MIGEGHDPGFEASLARLGVGGDGGDEADAGAALARGGDGEGGDLHRAAEELALSRGGISHEEDVDVPAEVGAVGEVLLAPP